MAGSLFFLAYYLFRAFSAAAPWITRHVASFVPATNPKTRARRVVVDFGWILCKIPVARWDFPNAVRTKNVVGHWSVSWPEAMIIKIDVPSWNQMLPGVLPHPPPKIPQIVPRLVQVPSPLPIPPVSQPFTPRNFRPQSPVLIHHLASSLQNGPLQCRLNLLSRVVVPRRSPQVLLQTWIKLHLRLCRS
jgi:hypothetical protein